MTDPSYYVQTRLSTVYNQTGESTSTLKLTLRNLTSQNFPASLTVNIHGDKINLLSAKDDYGDVSFVSSFQPAGINSLTVYFNRRNVGKNALTHLTLVYQNPKAKRQDNTWLIFYPKISLNHPGDFVYQLSVPNSFGRLVAAEIMPESKPVLHDTTLYTLAGKTLDSSPRLIFGDSYPYQFQLLFENVSEAVLPKDTESQKIYITQIQPAPVQVALQNSNWIAKYDQPQKQILVSGFVIYFSPDSRMQNSRLVKFESHPYQYLPAKDIHISLSPPKYFYPLIANTVTFHISNPNAQALYNINLSLSSPNLSVYPSSPLITAIPPSGTADLPISVRFGPNSLFGPKNIQVTAQNLNFSYNPPKDALIFYYLFYSVIISLVLIFTLAFARHAWRIFVSRRPS